MKSLQIYRLTPVLFLTLTVFFTACDGLTGTDPDEPNAPALEESAALRTAQIQEEPVVRDSENLGQAPRSFTIGDVAPDLSDKPVDFSASVVGKNAHSITVQIAARANDGNTYFVFRLIEGQAPVPLLYIKGSSLQTVTETLPRDNADRWVEYSIQDDGGSVVVDRIRITLPRTNPQSDRLLDFSASVVTESFRSITVRFAVRAADNDLYYVLRQIEGQAPVLVRYFIGSSLPTVTETLAKDEVDRWVEYWIVDDGGAEVTARIRFQMPRAQAQALP